MTEEELEWDITLISGQIDFLSCGKLLKKALPVLVCFQVPLFSCFDTYFVKCFCFFFVFLKKRNPTLFLLFVCFLFWSRCSCKPSFFSNKTLLFWNRCSALDLLLKTSFLTNYPANDLFIQSVTAPMGFRHALLISQIIRSCLWFIYLTLDVWVASTHRLPSVSLHLIVALVTAAKIPANDIEQDLLRASCTCGLNLKHKGNALHSRPQSFENSTKTWFQEEW